MAKQIANNYAAYQSAFEKDTGLKYKDNIPSYIAYYNARSSDSTMQVLAFILEELVFQTARMQETISVIQAKR